MLIPIFYIDFIENFSITLGLIHEICNILFIYLKKLLLTI